MHVLTKEKPEHGFPNQRKKMGHSLELQKLLYCNWKNIELDEIAVSLSSVDITYNIVLYTSKIKR